MKTYSAKPSDITREWFLIDATDVVLGRLAAEVAKRLYGKHKPYFTPNMDCGDNIIIINADKIHLTGNKLEDKQYFWHTGYPGGIKERKAKDLAPEKVVKQAILRMIDKSPLRQSIVGKLHVYAGTDHPHEAQKPTTYDFGAQNPKNKKRK